MRMTPLNAHYVPLYAHVIIVRAWHHFMRSQKIGSVLCAWYNCVRCMSMILALSLISNITRRALHRQHAEECFVPLYLLYHCCIDPQEHAVMPTKKKRNMNLPMIKDWAANSLHRQPLTFTSSSIPDQTDRSRSTRELTHCPSITPKNTINTTLVGTVRAVRS